MEKKMDSAETGQRDSEWGKERKKVVDKNNNT